MFFECSDGFIGDWESTFLLRLRSIKLFGRDGCNGVSFSLEGVALHLNPGRGKGLSALGNPEGDEGKCFMLAKSAVTVLKGPSDVLSKVEVDRPLTLKTTTTVRIEAGKSLLKKVWLIHWTLSISGLAGREVRNGLATMPHCVSPFMAFFPQVCETPLHQFVGGDIGKVTVDRS